MVGSEIFVQVPAYRDSELPKTLLDLYAKAHRPEDLRVCVLWQSAPDDLLPPAVLRLPRLEILQVPYSASGGPNWARHRLQRKWRGEPFTLLLDSHERFVRDWDTSVLEMYAALRRRGVAKPLISSYLPAYQPEREPGGRKKCPYKIYSLGREHGLLTRLTSYPIPFWRSLSGPTEGDFISLHFLFTAGRFNCEVPFDPQTYFFGDEVVTSVRAYSNGYDIFHPHTVLGWHCYDRASRIPHWDDHRDWHLVHERSLEKIRRLFAGRYRGRYGIGARRSVHQYEQRIMAPLIRAR